jgi:membrane associated rhomboid family serine protease
MRPLNNAVRKAKSSLAPFGKVVDNVDGQVENAVENIEDHVEGLPSKLADFIQPYNKRLASFLRAIHIDAPLTLTFAFVCVFVQMLSSMFGNGFVISYFAIHPWRNFNFRSPISYLQMITQIFGHGNWEHLTGNMINLLLVGPTCERVFGLYNLLKIIVWTAIASSMAHMGLGPSNAVQLGASGVVFMLILLNSLVEAKTGRIPLTFVCQICLWCNKEIVAQLFSNDNVSHIAHLSGAIVGTWAGYHFHGHRVNKRVESIGSAWYARMKAKIH